MTWFNVLDEGLCHCVVLLILPWWSIQTTARPGRQGLILFSWATGVRFYVKDCQVIQPEASGLFWHEGLLGVNASRCNTKTAKDRNKTFHRGNANLTFFKFQSYTLIQKFFSPRLIAFQIFTQFVERCCPAILHPFFWQLKKFWNIWIVVEILTSPTSEVLFCILRTTSSRHMIGERWQVTVGGDIIS